MKKMRNPVIIIALSVTSCLINPQLLLSQHEPDNLIEVSAGFDLVSRYVWRGLTLSNGPSIQPSVIFTHKGLSVGAWGSASFMSEDSREVDLNLSYEKGSFTFSIYDYFYAMDSLNAPYANYKKDESMHVIEAIGEWNPPESWPLRFLASVNLFGDENNSSYFEAAYMTTIGTYDCELFAGYTPQNGYYHPDKRGVTNVGLSASKTIVSGEKIEIPLKVSCIFAPLYNQAFIIISLGIY
jgi:hypothetical protein